MKKSKFLFIGIAGMFLVSCGGYTDDQANAADEFCSCMENSEAITGDEEMDFSINFTECDMKLLETYSPETFADEGWALALEEKCPSVAGQITE